MTGITLILILMTIFSLLVSIAACMNPWTKGETVIVSLGITIILCAVMMVSTTHDMKAKGYQTRGELNKLLVTCEANLPRTQRCTLVAVPKSVDKVVEVR